MAIKIRPEIQACGLLFCYNEEHILRHTLEHYLSQGVDLVAFDNCSTDSSQQIAAGYLDDQRFPGRLLDVVEVVTDGYEWGKILRTASDYMHGRLSGYDWIVLIDADAFYESPVRGSSLVEFMADAQRCGYNIIDGRLFDFHPTGDDDETVANPLKRIRYCRIEPYGPLPQHKLFRYHPSVDFFTHMGHQCLRDGARPGPLRFIYRHYPWVSYEHGVQKIFKDRKPRYVQRKENPIYHTHYLELLPRREDLVRDSAGLSCFDGDRERISRAGFYAAAIKERIQPLQAALANALRAARYMLRAARALPGLSRRFMEVAREDRLLALLKAAVFAVKRTSALMTGSTNSPAPSTGTAEAAAETLCDPGAADCQDMAGAVDCQDDTARTKAKTTRPEPPAADKTVSEEEAAQQKAAAVGFPHTYHFLMTTACNARCVFCNQDPNQPRQEITLEKFKAMVSRIPVESARYFYLSGGGDPLLCRDFFPILRYINEEFPWIRVHVRTNGLLIRKYAAELADSDIRLEVSVHAASEKLNNKILRSSKSGDIFTGIELLNDELAARGKAMEKAFFPALSALNIDDLPELIQTAARLDVPAVESYFCRCYVGGSYEGEDRIRAEDSLFYSQDDYDRTISEAEALAARLGVCFMHEPRFSEEFCARPCYEPWRMMLVDWNGEVFPCCGGEMWFKDKVAAGEYRFGNLLEEDLYQLWNNETYVMIRRTLSPHYDDNLVPECANCHSILCFRGPGVEEGHIINVG